MGGEKAEGRGEEERKGKKRKRIKRQLQGFLFKDSFENDSSDPLD
jgi:hypothetical protein